MLRIFRFWNLRNERRLPDSSSFGRKRANFLGQAHDTAKAIFNQTPLAGGRTATAASANQPVP